MMSRVGGIPRDMLGRLTCFIVEHWGGSSSGDMSIVDRATGDLNEAHVVSSKVKIDALDLHLVVLDIDHQAFLVPSSTAGHHHLYVDIPPVGWEDYKAFLLAAAKIGLIEQGYADASIRRGHSDLRLPWVRKGEAGDFSPKRPMLRCSGCKLPAHEIEEYKLCALAEKWADDETDRSQVTDSEILEWVWKNEGTLNRTTGFLACTTCYIKMGMPSGTTSNENGSWTAGSQPHRYKGPAILSGSKLELKDIL